MPPCCCPSTTTPPWQIGVIHTPIGPVPQIPTTLTRADQLGALKVRCNLGRQNYRVAPGLYAVGQPDATAPVLVTANYKLTFDRLRQELGGLNLWILVLDTDGINVWCAAGKGSFGTAEIVHRVATTHLPEIVQHRHLILPQLGAPGVAAHEVNAQCGFRTRVQERDACMECGACQRNCPTAAIHVAAGVGCASGLMHQALGLKNECACSPDHPCC